MRRPLLAGVVLASTLVAAVVAWPDPVGAVVLSGTFSDDDGSVHESGIEAIAAAGITVGCNPAGDRFCPDGYATRAQAAAFLNRALGLPQAAGDFFVDDEGHLLEDPVNRIAAAGITRGCTPAGDRFCPDDYVSRAQFAAFLDRALGLPEPGADYFVDDEGHLLEEAVNRIAAAGITRGCAPDRFCPDDPVTRAEVATFLTRAFDLAPAPQRLPLANWDPITCSKDGQTCQVVVETSAGRPHLIEEGIFSSLPYRGDEEAQFLSPDTVFTLTWNGAPVPLTELPPATTATEVRRVWSTTLVFQPGEHTLIGEWRWNGVTMQRTTVYLQVG